MQSTDKYANSSDQQEDHDNPQQNQVVGQQKESRMRGVSFQYLLLSRKKK
jgi:hypothetical protein